MENKSIIKRMIKVSDSHTINKNMSKQCKISAMNESRFPVIKLSLNGEILYANLSSLPIMSEWGCSANHKLPAKLMEKYPELNNMWESSDIKVIMESYSVHFSVVPFPEAGFIGLYAYEMEEVKEIVPMVYQMQAVPQNQNSLPRRA